MGSTSGGYGGAAAGSLAFCLAAEEVAWACASTSTIFLVQTWALPDHLRGQRGAEAAYLPKLASGEMTAAFSLSEAGSGSDAAAMTCRAVRRGDRYVLNGSKMWVTNGSHAGVITVFVTTDPGKRAKGVTALLVEPGLKGFTVGKAERKLGIHGSPTVALHFSDCEVPVENRLGEEGEGFKARCGPSSSRAPPSARRRSDRPGRARRPVAYARSARLRSAHRRLPGHPVMLADMAIAVHASRLASTRRLADRPRISGTSLGPRRPSAWLGHRHEGGHRPVQIFGVRLHTGVPGERFMRDAKITQIYEGTNQIQRVVIAQQLLGKS